MDGELQPCYRHESHGSHFEAFKRAAFLLAASVLVVTSSRTSSLASSMASVPSSSMIFHPATFHRSPLLPVHSRRQTVYTVEYRCNQQDVRCPGGKTAGVGYPFSSFGPFVPSISHPGKKSFVTWSESSSSMATAPSFGELMKTLPDKVTHAVNFVMCRALI